MMVQEPGPISEHLIFLGDNRICMYLLMGERHLLLGGGMSHAVPEIEEQLDRFDIDRSRIMGLVILHSHFDHCGAVPYFEKAYPQWEIMGSKGAEKIFGMEKAVKSIARLDKATRERYGVDGRFQDISLNFHAPALTRTLKEGDRIDLGSGVEVSILETPGHSKCSITAYSPGLNLLFPSDAAPLPVLENGGFVVMANDSLPTYLQSLARMADLTVDGICYEHCGAILGPAAQTALEESLKLTKEKIDFYRQALASGVDKRELAHSEVKKILDNSRFGLITEEILMQVCLSMLESVDGSYCP
ncbi:MAG: MBL fold metallo-hydrolase [Desulfobacteraceae bacterium]|nr:MAG: MBL fold metallo-hydrolase [Desulfobacteraceae bacterium]